MLGALLHPLILWTGLALAVFSVFFFRDPDRTIMAEPGQIFAPADGKVLSIDEVEDTEYMGGRCKRIGIFLSILDVHINRSPIAGKIDLVRYRPGKFSAAYSIEASTSNENNIIGIEGDVKIMVKQIAGLVARRIVCWCKPHQTVRAGERIGMIRFGSRTELYLPLECEIFVSVGQKVKGGLSLVAICHEPLKKKA
ncbi:MAG: phosphatidylserine decarboxylase [Candidatus Abyssubacteria bacterium]